MDVEMHRLGVHGNDVRLAMSPPVSGMDEPGNGLKVAGRPRGIHLWLGFEHIKVIAPHDLDLRTRVLVIPARLSPSGLRPQVQVGAQPATGDIAVVMVLAPADVDGDEVQLAVPYAAFRGEGMGEGPYRGRGAAQDDALQAIVVVEVGVQGGDGQVVLAMLQGGQSLGQVALVMVVDVGEIGDAMAIPVPVRARGFQVRAHQVPHGFGTVLVAALGDELVKLGRQVLVNGNRDAFHNCLQTPANARDATPRLNGCDAFFGRSLA